MAKYLCSLLITALFLGVLTSTSSVAQPTSDQQMARFKLADSYLRTGRFERAIPLLEDLYATDSTSVVYFRKLKEAYAGQKQYEKAISLVEDRLSKFSSPSLMAQKAALLSQRGRAGQALETWQSALDLAPDRSGTYRAVYLSMIEQRQFDEAIAILREGRKRLDQPRAFAIDLAHLYGLTSRHETAAEEYLDILTERPEQLPIVKRRISRYSDQDGALESTLKVVERRIEDEPSYRPFRELAGWLYLQTGSYQAAFDEFRAIDRLEQQNGSVLYSFARQASDAGAYDTAGEAYDLILERYPDAPSAPDAQLGLAQMHRRQAEEANERAFDHAGNRREAPHYSSALDTYQGFVQRYPDHPRHAQTLLDIGVLQLNVFRNTGNAESVFRQVTEEYPETTEAHRARLNLGRIAIFRNNLDEAQLTFSRIEDTVSTGDIAETARFELARLHFYRGHFVSATSLARALTQNTSTDVANDALELKVLLTGNTGPDSLDTPLKMYARARLFERQRRYDMARERVDSLLSAYPQHSLNDESFYFRAELMSARGEFTGAADEYLQLAARYPESPLADKSLFRAGRLYENSLDDRQAALETYNRLLEEYPGSLLLPDARQRIRALRQEA